MVREDVFKLINGERNYQDLDVHNVGHDDSKYSVADWIIFMEKHIQLAKEAVYMLDESIALEQIRKTTALGVACMEHNETKPRIMPDIKS